jgi:hypothetical protein
LPGFVGPASSFHWRTALSPLEIGCWLSVGSEKLTEAVLYPALVLSRFGQLEPLLSDPQPRLLVERACNAGRVFSGFLGLLAESGGIVGHAS